MNKRFFFTRTELPPEAAQAGAKILWRPSFVFFQADLMVKGLALFTTHENADGYRLLLEQQQSYPITIELFEDIPAYAACVVEAVRSANKAYKKTPIYIDPTSLFCKGIPLIRPNHDSLEKFLFRHFQASVPWAHDVVGFTQDKGYTIELLKDRATGRFIAICMKGEFSDRESISAAIEDVIDTNEEYHTMRTEPLESASDAIHKVAEHITRIATSR